MSSALLLVHKTRLRIGRHENKEKHPFYFGLSINLLIQNQLLDIENPKNPEIDSPFIFHSLRSLP
jgi:hypothetical protein